MSSAQDDLEGRSFQQSEAGLYLYLAHPDVERFRNPYIDALSKDYIDGVALVVRWDRVQPQPGLFDWSELDSWIKPTVSQGKKLSLGIIAGFFTPAWIYTAPYSVPKNTFDFDRSSSGKSCATWSQPSVWHPAYLHEYALLMTALADHLRTMRIVGMPEGSALRALRIIKLSGINNTSEELRVDSTAGDTGPCHQSDAAAVWAQAGFTPDRVVHAVESLAASTISAFPNQRLGLAIIHRNAFPPVDDEGHTYSTVPIPDALTARILRAIIPTYGRRLMVQWNALWQGAPPPEVLSAERSGASIGWQMNGFMGAWGGSGCIYPHWMIGACKSVADFGSILDNGINIGASYIEVQIGSVLEAQWQPAFQAAHARLLAARQR